MKIILEKKCLKRKFLRILIYIFDTIERDLAYQTRAYFYSPLDGMLVHCRVTPSIKFAGTHLYTWVVRGTVRVKCLAQEHNTVSPARSRTWTARSGVNRSW